MVVGEGGVGESVVIMAAATDSHVEAERFGANDGGLDMGVVGGGYDGERFR